MSSPPIPSAPGAAPPRLQLAGITKRYPAVVANSGVSLTVQPGETLLGPIALGTPAKRPGGAARKPHAAEVLLDWHPPCK